MSTAGKSNVMIRMSKKLHLMLKERANKVGMSMNLYCIDRLEAVVEFENENEPIHGVREQVGELQPVPALQGAEAGGFGEGQDSG